MGKNYWYIIIGAVVVLWFVLSDKPKDGPPVLVDPIKKETAKWDTNVPAARDK